MSKDIAAAPASSHEPTVTPEHQLSTAAVMGADAMALDSVHRYGPYCWESETIPGDAMAKGRTIGKLAAEVGVNVETVRFYERAGILEQPSRRSEGWREYDDERLVTLQYVREARRLGLTVADIGHLHEHSRGPQADFCESVRDTVAKRIETIDARIADLMRTRAGLVEWLGACRARSAADRCPTYAALKASREPGSAKS